MNQHEFEQLAELFKIFGTPTRLQILYALLDQEKCVYDIANELDMSQSAISHQLSILKQNRLVKGVFLCPNAGRKDYLLLSS